MHLSPTELKEFLDVKVEQYNTPSFIPSDPIQVPHSFSKKEDIEISALLTATIAWGQRKTIISNAFKMMDLMDQSPQEFILNASPIEIKRFENFKHRTFNAIDMSYFTTG